jgi:predicted enzyme related to lactoylglutathione lyase
VSGFSRTYKAGPLGPAFFFFAIARNVKTQRRETSRLLPVIRHLAVLCTLLVPTIAVAQTPTSAGAPVVFFSVFGPNGSELQKFYADVFDWKVAASGDVATTATPPLTGTITQGVAETMIYVGVADITATLQKVVARGGTVRYPRFEVPGRVILGIFKDPAGNSIGLVEMENGKAKIPK